MWITLAVTDVSTTLAGAEVSALQTAALSSGQSDPVAAILADVVNEVRGYVAASGTTLGEGATIPDKLKSAALALCRYRCATRLPVKSFLTEDRKNANTQAIELLRDVAARRFAVEEPETADTTEAIAGPRPAVTARVRRFTRDLMNGI